MNSSVLQISPNDNVHFLNSMNIYCCLAQDDYTEIGKKYLINSCFSAIGNRLNKNQFVRIHRSWIVEIGRSVGIKDHIKLLLPENDEIVPFS